LREGTVVGAVMLVFFAKAGVGSSRGEMLASSSL
jgi:hypothetical protein